jgi:hypothetical protein
MVIHAIPYLYHIQYNRGCYPLVYHETWQLKHAGVKNGGTLQKNGNCPIAVLDCQMVLHHRIK